MSQPLTNPSDQHDFKSSETQSTQLHSHQSDYPSAEFDLNPLEEDQSASTPVIQEEDSHSSSSVPIPSEEG